ncbi:3-oxoacyl-ACP reductase FabG [Streptomyces sp. NPDC000345]|uniref:3-oxoacyl-ACP reductase FabG n=1 Tax=Streptomyces sp. NPDC000345 TaxID=3364537 RepID=UPI0036795405
MPDQSRVAIVTGAARGIGAAVARRLANDGHRVAVVDLDAASCAPVVDAIVAVGGSAIGLGADISEEAAVDAAVEECAERLGAPTILINNAGITRDNLLFKMTTADWDSVMSVHLRGSFLMSRAVQRWMVQERWGRIVSMSSTSALGNRGQANYAAAKAGLQGFTKTLAIELGPFGITVNAIAPGFIATDMLEATAARMGKSYDELLAEFAGDIPVGRTGTVEDIAAAASFFVKDEASFTTGQTLYVAGGPRC